jgi:ABC-type cobalamin/Fe3+-siderophores transport system ATPase subunit
MNSNPDDIIVVKNLHKRFGSLVALGNISLTIKRGSVTVIIGPSGSGKSTLLRCLNHLEVQTSGEVYIDGALLTKNPKHIDKPMRDCCRDCQPPAERVGIPRKPTTTPPNLWRATAACGIACAPAMIPRSCSSMSHQRTDPK